MRLTAIAPLLAACWSSEKPPATKPAEPTREVQPEPQRRATVRIDPEAGGKGFQGVWLEHADGKRFVIAYRPREYWRVFENHEVVVTGECYEPFGQAIAGTHFRVDTMRFLNPKSGAGPFLEVGPATKLRGTLDKRTFPAGTKLGGSQETLFVADGTTYGVLNAADEKLDRVTPGEKITVEARAIRPDMSWTAQTGGPKIWIEGIADDPRDPREADKPTPCP